MVCNHLKQLYELCQSNQLRLGGSDLIRVVCTQCGETDTCPSVLMDEYDARIAAGDETSDLASSASGKQQQPQNRK